MTASTTVPLRTPPPALHVTVPFGAPTSPALRRLDTVHDQLSVAEAAVGELVRSLRPVLPEGFPARPTSPDAQQTEDAVATSPLAMGLAELAARGGALVAQLRALCDAVDL